MKVWDGSAWQTVAPFSERASCYVGPDAPVGTAYAGDLWWDTDDPTIAYPGAELAYNQITALVNVTAANSATAQTIVTAPATTFDGSPVVVEFYAPYITVPNVSGGWVQTALWDGSTDTGILSFTFGSAGTGIATPVCLRRRLIPTVGSHTYSIRAFQAGGTGVVGAGTGPGGYQPAFIRVTRV
jgi:hypothetical protein